jgi:hypothetical protein
VPLRAAGKVHGALVFRAPRHGISESHIDTAQRLADLAAADLELLRLGSMLPTTKRPGEGVASSAARTAVRAMPASPPLRSGGGARL